MHDHPAKKFWVVLLLVLGLSLAAYGPSLNSSFKTLDDERSVVQNERIQNPARFHEILTSSFFGKNAYYRPLVLATYLVEYQLFGLTPLYYYFDNILIHVVCALLVWALINTILKMPGRSALIAILFAIHPVQWEAVSNIPGRAILLSGMFSLASFVMFLWAEEAKAKRLYILSLISFILALLSKESAGILPVMLVSYQILVGGPRNQTPFSRSMRPLLPFFVILAAYAGLRHLLGITQMYLWRSPHEAGLGFLTFLRGTMTYLRLMILPTDLHFDRSIDLFASYDDPEVRWVLGFYILLSTVLFAFRRRISREAMFFVFWFFIELIPVSQFLVTIGVQPGTISLAEHFLYLPSIGFLAVLVLAVYSLYDWSRKTAQISPRFFGTLVFIVYAFFWMTTLQQTLYSSQEISMLKRSLDMNPRNARIQYSLGLVLAEVHKFVEAESHFRRALEIDPTSVRFRIALGKCLIDQGNYREGIAEYEKIEEPGKYKEVLEENLQAAFHLLNLH